MARQRRRAGKAKELLRTAKTVSTIRDLGDGRGFIITSGILNICVLVVVILGCNFVSGAFLQAGQCPPPNKVYNDKPTCFSDADCQKWGKVCCRNQHNTMSCTDRAPWRNNYNDNKDKYSGVGGGGVYCDGVKCKPYEVCKPDRYTKRLKCQRA